MPSYRSILLGFIGCHWNRKAHVHYPRPLFCLSHVHNIVSYTGNRHGKQVVESCPVSKRFLCILVVVFVQLLHLEQLLVPFVFVSKAMRYSERGLRSFLFGLPGLSSHSMSWTMLGNSFFRDKIDEDNNRPN